MLLPLVLLLPGAEGIKTAKYADHASWNGTSISTRFLKNLSKNSNNYGQTPPNRYVIYICYCNAFTEAAKSSFCLKNQRAVKHLILKSCFTKYKYNLYKTHG